MEINKEQPNEKSQSYLFKACYSKRVRTCILAETKRQAEEWENFILKKKEKKRGRLQACPDWGDCWHREAGVGHLMWLVRGTYLAFADWF